MRAERWMTLKEAARRADRSYHWAYDRATDGRLERCPDSPRRILVSVASVAAEIAKASARSTGARPRLRLVIDNTK